MIHGLSFKEYVEEEKAKFGEMTAAEKKDYFKEYYLKQCIFAFIILILLIWFLVDISVNFKHTVCSGGVINTKISEEGAGFLKEDYLKLLNKKTFTNKVDLAADIFLDKEEPQTYTVFQAELAINSYNYLITDKNGLDFILSTECLADMGTVLDEDLKKTVGDKIVRGELGESKKEIEAAIDITDTAFVKEYITSGDKVYFVITGKEDEYNLGLDVLRYILNKK